MKNIIPVIATLLMLGGCANTQNYLDIQSYLDVLNQKECTYLGKFPENSLGALFAQHKSFLVVMDEQVFTCPCSFSGLAGAGESRQIAGASESRQIAGASESRQIAGASESRQLAGAGESRQIAGAGESRQIAGAGESRQIAGASESRQLAGASESRQLAGASESRQLGGAGESRQLAGAGEDRLLMGGDRALICYKQSSCNGFMLKGVGHSYKFFDGVSTKEVQNGCVR